MQFRDSWRPEILHVRGLIVVDIFMRKLVLILGLGDQIFARTFLYYWRMSEIERTSKVPKWLSLRPLALKSKFIRQFEFSRNLEDLCGKCCWRALIYQLFAYKSSYSFKTSDCHKISFSDDGGLKLGHFWYFPHAFSISGIC